MIPNSLKIKIKRIGPLKIREMKLMNISINNQMEFLCKIKMHNLLSTMQTKAITYRINWSFLRTSCNNKYSSNSYISNNSNSNNMVINLNNLQVFKIIRNNLLNNKFFICNNFNFNNSNQCYHHNNNYQQDMFIIKLQIIQL